MVTVTSQPPIRTSLVPVTIAAPQPATSPIRNAGLPPINTLVLPWLKGVGACGPAVGGIAQAWVSPTTAAGMPPINTVDTPGPATVPG